MTGYEPLKGSADPSLSKTPFIMVTANWKPRT